MIDNFDIIIPLLEFDESKEWDEFYFVQILQRKKDNPNGVKGSNNSSRLIKAYYIDSVQKLINLKPEMVGLANFFGARVGINLNKRSYYKTAFNTLKHIAEQMHNKNFKKVHRAWNTACGVHNGGDKIWILDIDHKDLDIIKDIEQFVNKQQPIGKSKILSLIPSKSGYHLITTGFDTRKFRNSIYSDVEIHKNNPTNLYIP